MHRPVQLFLASVFVVALTVLTVTAQPQDDCGITPIPPLENNFKAPWLGRALDRIVGGIAARPGSWPWQIQVMEFGTHDCGASILDERWVLTAAHCFESTQNLASYTIKAGSYSKSSTDSTEQSRRVVRIIIHPNYDEDTLNQDIALMQVDRAFEWNNYVRPVCLPGEGDPDLPAGTHTFATGWGSTMGTGNSYVLKQVKVPIVEQSTCKNVYGSELTSYMLCAGYMGTGGHDACQGDSGGPLVAKNPTTSRWVLHGVISWGEECALSTHPGVYTRVSKYIQWIQNSKAKSA